jgi:hypothetical protein
MFNRAKTAKFRARMEEKATRFLRFSTFITSKFILSPVLVILPLSFTEALSHEFIAAWLWR